MRDRVLVDVYVPVSREHFDVWISRDLQVGVCVELLSKTIEEISNSRHCATNDAILCDYESGAIFNSSLTIEELRLGNGARVMLV